MVSRGELTTLLRWIEALPEDVALSRPWLCIHQAWPLTLADRADAAEPLLRQIERQIPLEDLSPEGQEILGHVAAMRAMAAMMRGDMPQAIELAHRAGELLPPDNVIPRNTTLYTLASAYYAQGELGKAGQTQAEVLELGRVADNAWMVVRTLCDLADLEMIQGQLQRAADLCHEALQEAEERGARQFGIGGYALVQLGEIFYERNDLIAAHDHALEGTNLMQGWERPYEIVRGFTTLATILQAQDDADGARQAMQRAEAIRSQHPSYPKLSSLVYSCQIRLCLAEEGPDEAARLATDVQLGQTGARIFREQEQMILARVLVAQQRWNEVLSLLARLAGEAEAGGRFGRLIETPGSPGHGLAGTGGYNQGADRAGKSARDGWTRGLRARLCGRCRTHGRPVAAGRHSGHRAAVCARTPGGAGRRESENCHRACTLGHLPPHRAAYPA